MLRHLYAISIRFSRNWPGPGPWVWLRLWEGIVRRLSMLEGRPSWSLSSPFHPPAQSRVLRGPRMEFRSHRGGGNSTLQSIHALSRDLLCRTKQCHGLYLCSLGNCICMNWQLYLKPQASLKIEDQWSFPTCNCNDHQCVSCCDNHNAGCHGRFTNTFQQPADWADLETLNLRSHQSVSLCADHRMMVVLM